MIHVTIPVTAKGEPIPLIKLGQGREEEIHKTFAEKLRAAGYQQPSIPNPHTFPPCDFCGFDLGSKSCLDSHTPNPKAFVSTKDSGNDEEKNTVNGKLAEPLPSVSREGFRAGVLSTIAGGAIIAGFYLAWGLVAACLFAAVCVGFVGGMLITQEWK